MAAKNLPPPKKKNDPVSPGKGTSEKPFRTIFEHTALPTLIVREDMIISLVNRKFCAMSGFSRREIEDKKTWMEFVAPDDVDSLARYLSLIKKPTGDVPGSYAFGFIDKKKHHREVLLTGGRIPGTHQYIFSLVESNPEEQLKYGYRCNNRQLSGVIYNIPEATFAVDRDGIVIAWNRAIEELTGGLGVDILGKGNREYSIPFFRERRPMIIDLIFASDTEIEDQGYSGIQWTGNTLSAEISVPMNEGLTRVIREIASPVFNESGKLAGAIESITDVTGLRQQETALQDSESRYRTILENTGSALAIIEDDNTISYLNPEFEKIIGYVREEIEGKKKISDFVAPEDLERFLTYKRACRINPHEERVNKEFRFIRFDGFIRNGILTITPVPDTGKLVISLMDITRKTREEEALLKANEKLNSFNFITRHEILNHLTVVKGYIELSREHIHKPSFHTTPFLLTFLEKELAAANAIQNLITFTRDYQNIGIRPPAWLNLSTLITMAAARVRPGPVVLTRGTDGVEIYADRMIEKVFFHLIDNAVRYGKKTRAVRFTCEESFEELLVVCEDDGIGIPKEVKETIFNRQLLQNSGVDMHLSRDIMSITGISIAETGTYGSGARFEIRIPLGAYRFTSPH